MTALRISGASFGHTETISASSGPILVEFCEAPSEGGDCSLLHLALESAFCEAPSVGSTE
jgi:hypothetical protein